jgi:hypothetical protein
MVSSTSQKKKGEKRKTVLFKFKNFMGIDFKIQVTK